MDNSTTSTALMSAAVQQLAQIRSALATRSPASIGTFTLAAAATTTITDANVTATSFVDWQPTNAGAATLMSGAKSLYRSTITPGTSFVVATADGNSAAGTETFQYAIWNTL